MRVAQTHRRLQGAAASVQQQLRRGQVRRGVPRVCGGRAPRHPAAAARGRARALPPTAHADSRRHAPREHLLREAVPGRCAQPPRQRTKARAPRSAPAPPPCPTVCDPPPLLPRSVPPVGCR
eukprot:7354503-Prymnesium_polylepis.1